MAGQPGVDLIEDLRERLPWISILYVANDARSTPDQEGQLPADVPILREPFTCDDLLAAVRPLLRRS